MAEQLGVTEDTLINWEKGRTKPTRQGVEGLKSLIPEILDLLGIKN